MNSRKSKRRKLSDDNSENNEINASEIDDTTCKECFAEFVDYEDLETHIAQVHHYKMHICSFCQTGHSSIEDLARHVRNDHLLKIVCCEVCNRAFIDNKLLSEHKIKHLSAKEKLYSCLNCRMLFNSTTDLIKHDNELHRSIGDGVNLYDLLPHLSSLLGMNANWILQRRNKKYSCGKCRYKSTILSDYLLHIKKNNCIVITCNKCSQTFCSKYNVAKHLENNGCFSTKKHYGDTKECNLCKEKILRSDYSKHMNQCISLKCGKCSELFTTLTSLAEHQAVAHPAFVVMHKCQYCNQDIVGPTLLKKHIESNHGHNYETYKYNCVHCDGIFNHPEKLFGHVFNKHRKIALFKCNICDTSFRLRKKFTVHIKLAHSSVGCVEFTKDFYVHFNKNKSKESGWVPPPKEKLFTDAQEELFKQLDLNNTNDKGQKLVKPLSQSTKKSKSFDWKKSVYTDNECTEIEMLNTDSSSEETQNDRSIVRKKKFTKKKSAFTCSICKKYFNVAHNYHRHMKIHFAGSTKQCIKCNQIFDNEKQLNSHVRMHHNTVYLTEHLKSLLEKRKLGTSRLSLCKTVKKVPEVRSQPAKIKLVNTNMSAKNFLESFTVDGVETKNNDNGQASITLKKRVGYEKRSWIQINKCTLTELPYDGNLCMPVPFSPESPYNEYTASITICNEKKLNKTSLNFGNNDKESTDSSPEEYVLHDYSIDDDNENVPDVDHEIVYENVNEETKIKEITQPTEVKKIYISKQTKEYGVRVATLLPEAPYYKIVPISELEKKAESNDENQKEEVELALPQGAKLVHSNPLQHLLTDKTPEVLKAKKKYYTRKISNPQNALAKALLKLQNPPEKKKRTSKKSKVQETAVSNEEDTDLVTTSVDNTEVSTPNE